MTDLYGNMNGEQSYTFKTGDFALARLVLPWQPLVYRAKGPQEVFFEHINLASVTVSLYPLEFAEFRRIVSVKHDLTNFDPKVDPLREWEPDLNCRTKRDQP